VSVMTETQDCARSLRLPAGERVMLRPIGPCDRDALQDYVRGLSRASRYNRFFQALQELPRADLDCVIHFDQEYQLALLAETSIGGLPIVIGETRCAFATDRLEAECALSVADAWHGRGLGTLLVADIECRARCGARYLSGDVLRSNEPMKALARKTGFLAADVPRDARLIRIVKDLVAATQGTFASIRYFDRPSLLASNSLGPQNGFSVTAPRHGLPNG
jgi:GNAT superfamily N-acetyltransferase